MPQRTGMPDSLGEVVQRLRELTQSLAPREHHRLRTLIAMLLIELDKEKRPGD